MRRSRTPWTDKDVESIMGRLLQVGVVCAAFVVLLGAIHYLIKYGLTYPHYAIFRGEPADLRSIPQIIREALTARGRPIIQLGLLMLIATPVARVVFAVIAFALERDRLYIAVSLIVLAILVFSVSGLDIWAWPGT